ncbi:MAG: carboxypeptidase-like regulatory domain-containing protein [Bacteroidota bacterium]
MKKVILFALVFMAAITIVNAGTPVVTEKKTEASEMVIKGKVFDKKTKEALVGATISIGNSEYKVYTDLEGNFEIKNVKEGNYNIVVSYISYNSSLIEQTIAKSNEIPSLEIELVENTK